MKSQPAATLSNTSLIYTHNTSTLLQPKKILFTSNCPIHTVETCSG